jgi:hypothetical protein
VNCEIVVSKRVYFSGMDMEAMIAGLIMVRKFPIASVLHVFHMDYLRRHYVQFRSILICIGWYHIKFKAAKEADNAKRVLANTVIGVRRIIIGVPRTIRGGRVSINTLENR